MKILLDTCILQYITGNKFAELLYAYLDELVERSFELIISDISIYELLSGITKSQEKVALETISAFPTQGIKKEVLVVASLLSSLYYLQNKLEGRTVADISLPDKIIASTSVLTDSFVITANINDFPRPYFKEVEEKQLFFKDKKINKMLVIQLLEPNYPILQQRFSERP